MKVKLLNNTPLWVCSQAIRKCHDNSHLSDEYTGCSECGSQKDTNDSYCVDCGTDIEQSFGTTQYAGRSDKALIARVGNKMKHGSTLEHLVYSFDISEISRALLQEMARHRIASLTVKSTRYTLKELKNEASFLPHIIGTSNDEFEAKRKIDDGYLRSEKYLVRTNHDRVDLAAVRALEELRQLLVAGIANDLAKYALPEAYKTSFVLTINARSLQNFLSLRHSTAALAEIFNLAQAIFNELPKDHKYLFCDYMGDGE